MGFFFLLRVQSRNVCGLFYYVLTVINGCAMNIHAAVQNDHFINTKKLHVVTHRVKERI